MSRELEAWKETDSHYSYQFAGNSIEEIVISLRARRVSTHEAIATLSSEANAIVERLYGISAECVRASILGNSTDEEDDQKELVEGDLDESDEASIDFAMVASSVLSYAIGCLFGRWDVRPLTLSQRKPDLSDLFDPLPVCSPGMLQDVDGLPPIRVPESYVLCIAWEGIYVDDPEHPDDVVRRVRDVLETKWEYRAEGIEEQVCEALDHKEVRDYFRKSSKGGFWYDHLVRYTKGRRRAPIYWCLQSSKRNYGLWLYYHRLDKDLLFKALVNYVEPKMRLESSRLEASRRQMVAVGESGAEGKRLAKDVERQEDFISELRDFEDKLRRAANLHLDPDLNDGVVLNIAPLHELVPWKEAKSYWEELLEGKYEWSSIGKQLRDKGLVK
jgi:hypothetical protein